MKHWNKEVAKEINPQITIKITKEDVVDILSSAIGGISYWGEIVPNDRQYEEAKKWLRENAEPDYDDGEICYEEVIAQILFDGKSVTVRDMEDDKESWLSLSNLARGIQTAFREGYYSNYNWLVNYEINANCRFNRSDVSSFTTNNSSFHFVIWKCNS